MSTKLLRGLKEHEIHLWWTVPERIRDESVLARQLAVLSAAEREKQRRFVFQRHRQQYLVSHALVRHVLSLYAPVPPIGWQFEVNHYGRPSISWPTDWQDLHFNLSHTDGRAVVAVAWRKEIGADVESTTPERNGRGIASSFFTPIENAQLERHPEMFFDFWTLKEAYIKARGMGLSIPLDGFSFLLSDNDRPRITFHDGCPDQPERWDFVLYRSEGYRAAVAFSAGSPERSRVVHREIVPLGSEEGGIIYRAMDIPPS